MLLLLLTCWWTFNNSFQKPTTAGYNQYTGPSSMSLKYLIAWREVRKICKLWSTIWQSYHWRWHNQYLNKILKMNTTRPRIGNIGCIWFSSYEMWPYIKVDTRVKDEILLKHRTFLHVMQLTQPETCNAVCELSCHIIMASKLCTRQLWLLWMMNNQEYFVNIRENETKR